MRSASGADTGSRAVGLRRRTALWTEAAEHAAAHQVTRPEAGGGRGLGADVPITGVGDEARVTDHGGLSLLVARKANVVLTVQYAPPERGAADQSAAESDAQALLDLIAVP